MILMFCLPVHQGEWKLQLSELDRELMSALPDSHRPDISFKSSSTPVRYIFELPVPVQSAGAHINYRCDTQLFPI
jgi:hypothetical protein